MYEHQIDTPNVKFANDKGGVGNAGFAEENPEVRISSWNIISSTERESYVFFENWKKMRSQNSTMDVTWLECLNFRQPLA